MNEKKYGQGSYSRGKYWQTYIKEYILEHSGRMWNMCIACDFIKTYVCSWSWTDNMFDYQFIQHTCFNGSVNGSKNTAKQYNFFCVVSCDKSRTQK